MQAPARRELNVPERPDDVTPAWLTEALHRTRPTAGLEMRRTATATPSEAKNPRKIAAFTSRQL